MDSLNSYYFLLEVHYYSTNKKSRYRLLGNDFFISAQRRPTLTGGIPQLPSALKSLTSVFGMGTGVTSSPSSLDYSAFNTRRTCFVNFIRSVSHVL